MPRSDTNGSRVVLRTTSSAFVRERGADESVARRNEAYGLRGAGGHRAAGRGHRIRPNGDYLTVGEGMGAPLYRYAR